MFSIIWLLGLFSFGNVLLSQEWTKDYKYHDAGLVRMLLVNQGVNWPSVSGPGLVNCEYPPNSGEEHIGINGIWVGGITPENDTLVSVTCSWNPNYLKYREFFPTAEPWDTIWVLTRGDIINIAKNTENIEFKSQDNKCSTPNLIINIINAETVKSGIIACLIVLGYNVCYG